MEPEAKGNNIKGPHLEKVHFILGAILKFEDTTLTPVSLVVDLDFCPMR